VEESVPEAMVKGKSVAVEREGTGAREVPEAGAGRKPDMTEAGAAEAGTWSETCTTEAADMTEAGMTHAAEAATSHATEAGMTHAAETAMSSAEAAVSSASSTTSGGYSQRGPSRDSRHRGQCDDNLAHHDAFSRGCEKHLSPSGSRVSSSFERAGAKMTTSGSGLPQA
jgi:hypothetical protein